MLGVLGTMTSDRPLRIEYCPVISAARDGVQAGSTINCVRAQSFARELVDARCRRAAQFAAAVGTQITVADVVGENEDDVGLGIRGLRGGCCDNRNYADEWKR